MQNLFTRGRGPVENRRIRLCIDRDSEPADHHHFPALVAPPDLDLGIGTRICRIIRRIVKVSRTLQINAVLIFQQLAPQCRIPISASRGSLHLLQGVTGGSTPLLAARVVASSKGYAWVF